MSLSVSNTGPATPVTQLAQAKSTATDLDSGAAKKSAAYGSTPAAVVTISAQAKVAAAKVYAIKHGRDPDGVQDGK